MFKQARMTRRLTVGRRSGMTFGSFCLAALLAVVMVSPGFSETNADQYKLPNFAQLIKQNDAAVVSITITRTVPAKQHQIPQDLPAPFKRFFQDQPGGKNFFRSPPERMEGEGSGFIISPDGYILTNAHVVDKANKVMVHLNDRSEYKGKVIGMDKRSDVALVKIDAHDLPTIKIGDSDHIKVGQWVLAIGSPFGFAYTATQGIVSAVGRSLPDGTYVPFIQTDAAVNPGNSGGPLFNLKGQVIGINSQIYTRSGGFQGLSFAIPINLAMNVVKQLKAHGRVTRGWLGVMIQDLNEPLAKSFGLSKPEGALVSEVSPHSPAAKAGLQPGDVILSYNGHKLERSSDLPPLVGETPIGENANLVVQRNGKKKDITVKIGELKDHNKPTELARANGHGHKLGVSVTSLSPDQRKQLGISEGGVLVQDVRADSPAADAGLQKGDVILAFDGHNITDVDQLVKLVKTAPTDKPSVVLIARNKSRLFLPINFG